MDGRLQISDDPRLETYRLIVFGSLFSLMMCFLWWLEGEDGVFGVLYAALLMAILLTSDTRYRSVGVDARFVYLSRGLQQETVPLGDVIEINASHGNRNRNPSVSLRYRNAFGRRERIWFRPRSEAPRSVARRWERPPNPAVEELCRRVAAAGGCPGRPISTRAGDAPGDGLPTTAVS